MKVLIFKQNKSITKMSSNSEPTPAVTTGNHSVTLNLMDDLNI